MPERKDFYVYVHRDSAGNIFYVGQGRGRRAWSKKRHFVWTRYVDERLGGIYEVEIVESGLTESASIEIESHWIEEYGPQLVNWINCGRDTDFEATDRFHKIRDANRQFVAETRPLEASDMELAVVRYRQALCRMREYEAIVTERGLIADLMQGTKWGDFKILDRLTLCLGQLGRFDEAVQEADRYFAEFPAARELKSCQSILRRIARFRSPKSVRENRS